MQLIQSQQLTMSSDSLLEIINAARKDAGEPEIRRNKFAEKVADELEGEHYTKRVVQNLNNTQSAVFDLSRDQCMLVSMRESKAVRRSVLDKINVLEQQQAPKLPATYRDALVALIAAEDAKEQALLERDTAVATKAEIGSRREATAMNTASQAVKKASTLEQQLDRSKEYCTVKRMSMIHHGQPFDWRALKAASAEMGITPIDVFDQNYGTVKAYHADVWREVYGLEI